LSKTKPLTDNKKSKRNYAMLDYNKYIIPLDDIELNRILKTWTWLVGENKAVIALTKIGDALLKDTDNKLFLLNTRVGALTEISGNYLDFINGNLNKDLFNEILLPGFINTLESKIILKPKQVYCFIYLPLIGGDYIKENIYAGDVYEHYNLTGEIHLQLKNLPDGTEVEFKVAD
jgi:hypothetical protein